MMDYMIFQMGKLVQEINDDGCKILPLKCELDDILSCDQCNVGIDDGNDCDCDRCEKKNLLCN